MGVDAVARASPAAPATPRRAPMQFSAATVGGDRGLPGRDGDGGREDFMEWSHDKVKNLTVGELDAHIESMISSNAMLDVDLAMTAIKTPPGYAATNGTKQGRKSNAPKSIPRLPRPEPMKIFRQVTGSAVHLYDWPSANNSYFVSTEADRVWRSDRHIILKDDLAPVFNPEAMVDFDDQDTFHVRSHWDPFYNTSVNVSLHDTTMEVSDTGKSAAVRLQTGDTITDHVIEHVYNGLNMDLHAIAVNITLTNWTPPAGWRLSSGADWHAVPVKQALREACYVPPTASYATWSQSRRTGVSRWALRVDAKNGQMAVGVMVPPICPPGVLAHKVRSPAWGIDDSGFSFHSDGSGTRQDRDLVVAGQVGINSWPPYFGQESLIWMVLDRDHRTLQLSVNSLAPFALYDVAPDAVPFVCAQMPGDGITLLSMREAALLMPTNLRNDLVARWSIASVTLPPLKTRKPSKNKNKNKAGAAGEAGAPPAEEGDGDRGASDAVMEDADSADATAEDPWYQPRNVDFWPGGRLKGPEFEGEERILEDLEETLTEERLHKMLAAVTSDRAG